MLQIERVAPPTIRHLRLDDVVAVADADDLPSPVGVDVNFSAPVGVDAPIEGTFLSLSATMNIVTHEI